MKRIPEIVNIRQASQYLGVSPDTLYKYVNEQKIPAFKLGNRWRFRKLSLDRWMREQSGEPENPVQEGQTAPANLLESEPTHLRKKNEYVTAYPKLHLWEVTYRCAESKEPLKTRVVASNGIWAMQDIYRRKYKGTKKEYLGRVDQGPVSIAGPRQDFRKWLLEHTDQLSAVLDAIEEDISQFEAEEAILEKHRQSRERIAKLKQRLAQYRSPGPISRFDGNLMQVL